MSGSRSSSRSKDNGSRSTSRRSQQRKELHRVESARHFDDHHHYPQHEVEDEAQELGRSQFPIDEDFKENAEPIEDHDREEHEEELEEVESKSPVAEKDVEAWPNKEKPQSVRSRRSNRSIRDPNLVTWDGPEDPQNPKNWSIRRKWAATFIVSCFTLISPISSSMVAPALGSISRDLDITSEVELQMTLSIFVLAYAFGPLVLGPLSEVYGRVRVLQLGNLFYLCWNLGCGFAQNSGQLIAFRFLSGIGGSAPLAVGGGVVGDTWHADQRGKAVGIYSLAPLLGPAIGPIAGGFIAQYSTWRWTFWATSIVCLAIQAVGFVYLQETYAPQILKKKASKLRKETGNQDLHTEWEDSQRKLPTILRVALSRPFRLLLTQPIIQFIAVYMAYLYGLMYLILSTFPTLWKDIYNESISIGGLNYISLGVGFTIATQTTAPLNDIIYRRLKKRNNGIGRPEFRVPMMFVGSTLLPISLFWYGWSAQARTHWIVPNIGAAIFAAGSIICFQSMQTYLIDSYTRYAASGIAAAVFLRSLAGFGFPLFAPAMYAALGYGWGDSVLGFLAIVIGIPAPFAFWYYGERLRMRSQFAAGGG